MAGIYVHIPFCHAKCAYCDFFSTPKMSQWADRVVDGIIEEYASRNREISGLPVETIYFGGGTPSCIPSDLLKRLCESLPMCTASERTIEVNPEDVDHTTAKFWREIGFNRVSMGVQSLNDKELAIINRRHNSSEAITAIDTLRAAGFDNISCDLIYGLPGQTIRTWTESLDMLLDSGIEHLSAYCLSYEPGTRLSAMLSAGKIAEAPDELIADMYQYLCQKTRQAGFEHYEISNFARPGFHSRHNSSYWHSVPYLGLGPAAHSCDRDGVRRAAPANISDWLKTGAIIEEETETDRINDIIITGLRTAEGLDLDGIPAGAASETLMSAKTYLKKGWLIKAGTRLIIPENHWLVSDAVMRDLLLD